MPARNEPKANCGVPEDCRASQLSESSVGGEAGIRTLGTGLSPYNGLANRRFRPLSHLTVLIWGLRPQTPYSLSRATRLP